MGNLKKLGILTALTLLSACTNAYTTDQPTNSTTAQTYLPSRMFSGCPAPVASGDARVVKSYGVGTCGFPFRDSTGRFWVTQTDFWVPIASGQTLRCSPHRLASLTPGFATTGQQVYVDPLSGLLSSRLPAGCTVAGHRIGTALPTN
ncbi:MAG: hypothetical protein ACPGVN_06825 [Alphaproteobacteria bacterium]